MNECICIENVSYILNKEEKTADIKTFLGGTSDYYIPRSIKYQSQEYLVTSILPYSSGYGLISIQFAPDSELKTIREFALRNASIESISFPSSLINLGEGWCDCIEKLTKITISPQNPKYKLYNNMIIGKSSLDSKNFDTLVFCPRNIKELILPNFIEVIEPYAIEKISKLKINPDSKLREIKKYSICDSDIKSIYIPPSVVYIQGCCFNKTPNLNVITVDPKNKHISVYDNKLIITKLSPEKENFDVVLLCFPGTKSVTIPDFIEVIAAHSFEQCDQLQKVEISQNSKLQSIEEFAFKSSTINSITIPPHVKKIGRYAFSYCNKLNHVNITPDSELRIIEPSAFEGSMINSFFIPQFVTKICEKTFFKCYGLNRIEIPENSKLEVIETNAFFQTTIESIHLPQNFKKFEKRWSDLYAMKKPLRISFSLNNKFFTIIEDKIVLTKSAPEQENFDMLVSYMTDDETVNIPDSIEVIGFHSFFRHQNLIEVVIPEKIRIIEDGAFLCCKSLKKVVIPLDSQLQEIGSSAFYQTPIESFFIPSHVKKIGDMIFYQCLDLKKVEIATNSELESIGNGSFMECSSIESISFPPSLKNICCKAFQKCTNLKIVEFDPNIKLEKLDDYLFDSTLIEEISIPSSITRIGEGAFNDCKNLKRIEIPKNSKLEVIDSNAFCNTQVESLFLPANLAYLNEGWCNETNKLNEIIVDQENKSFILVDNKLLLSKSSPEKENFDVLVFCARNAQNVTIPDFVEIIRACSFYNCTKLTKVDISKESKLRIIGENAFNNCKSLRNVDFQTNSELKVIEPQAFSNCSLRKIIFPPSLRKIGDNAFNKCRDLCSIEFPINSELNMIGEAAFLFADIKGIWFPYHLKRIGRQAFYSVIIIEVGESSDIEFIDPSAFSNSLKIIMVPHKKSKEFLVRVQDVFNPYKNNKYLPFEYSNNNFWLLFCMMGIFCIFFCYLYF